jgi:hypothetical protein
VNGGGGDLGIELKLPTDLINSIEQHNLYEYARRSRRTAGVDPPRPVLAILQEFFDEKVGRAIHERNFVRAVDALGDLRDVLEDFVRFSGRPEFKVNLERVNFEMARILETCRTRLVRDYLSLEMPEEELPRIHAILCEIIRRGAWPTWKQDYDKAIQAEAERRASSPPIVPAQA